MPIVSTWVGVWWHQQNLGWIGLDHRHELPVGPMLIMSCRLYSGLSSTILNFNTPVLGFFYSHFLSIIIL